MCLYFPEVELEKDEKYEIKYTDLEFLIMEEMVGAMLEGLGRSLEEKYKDTPDIEPDSYHYNRFLRRIGAFYDGVMYFNDKN